jgi:hypothetical protein
MSFKQAPPEQAITGPNGPTEPTEIDPPWSDAVVLVCSKCFQRRGDQNEALRSAEEVKGYLKSEFKNRVGKERVRVVISSCLDICPDDRLAIAVARRNQTPATRAITVPFSLPLADLYSLLESKALPKD